MKKSNRGKETATNAKLLSDISKIYEELKREDEDRSRWLKSSLQTCHTRQKTEEDL